MDSINNIRLETQNKIKKLIDENAELQDQIKQLRVIENEKIKLIQDEEQRKLEEKQKTEQALFEKFAKLGVDKNVRSHILCKAQYSDYELDTVNIISSFFGKQFCDQKNRDTRMSIEKYITQIVNNMLLENLIVKVDGCYQLYLPVEVPIYKDGKILIELEYKGEKRQYEMEHYYSAIFRGVVGDVPHKFEIDFEKRTTKWDYSYTNRWKWDGCDYDSDY